MTEDNVVKFPTSEATSLGDIVDLSRNSAHRWCLYVVCPVTFGTIDEMKKTKQAVQIATEKGEEVPEEFGFTAGEAMGMVGPQCLKCGGYWEDVVEKKCEVGDAEFLARGGGPGKKWFMGLRERDDQ